MSPERSRRRSRLTTFAVELIQDYSRPGNGRALRWRPVGYKAVLIADYIPPVLVDDRGRNSSAGAGACARGGVAGLQAIATARRLGAVVEAYDVRAAAGEQVRSLGQTSSKLIWEALRPKTRGVMPLNLARKPWRAVAI